MTNDELKEKLDELGIEYATKATKAELEALLKEALKPIAPPVIEGTPAEPNPEPEPEPTTETAAELIELAAQCVRVRSTGDTAAEINVRREPGGAVLMTVPDGTEFATAGDVLDGWQPVQITAWVMAELVEVAE